MDDSTKATTTPVAPAVAAFGTCGLLAMGFGAGYGTRSYHSSVAFKELIEKFPEPPTAEAEAFARSGAARAFVAGTGLAALMGVGAVAVARSYGIRSIADFAEEARRWLPSEQELQRGVSGRLEPLQRNMSENLQTMRDRVDRIFQQSEMGSGLRKRAARSVGKQTAELQPWEKELIDKLEDLGKQPPVRR